MKRILVTGAAGFIGWKVCEVLLDEGYAVGAVDNMNDAYDVCLKRWRVERLQGEPGFQFHVVDIRNREALRRLFIQALSDSQVRGPGASGEADGGWSGVINLAARAGVRQSVENPAAYFETNVNGVLNLLELCREFGVKKFVQASTSSVYGALNSRPFREDAPTDGPLSPYAASKKAAEGLCYSYHYLHGIDVTVLRYFTVYGPAGRPDMSLFRFVQWISEGRPVTVYGDGSQERDFTYVDDIAQGTVAGLKPVGYEIINLGSDMPIALNEAIRVVERLIGRRSTVRHQPRHRADVLATWADIAKAQRLLGWRPATPFEEGVASLVTWYRENRSWARELGT